MDSFPLKSGMSGKFTEILDFLLGEILKEREKDYKIVTAVSQSVYSIEKSLEALC